MIAKEAHKPIWDFLLGMIGNPYGAAGLMGNLFAESSLNLKCVTGREQKTSEMKQNYIQAMDELYTMTPKEFNILAYNFSRDGVAVGLAQWVYPTRKENLLQYARLTGKGTIWDSMVQLEFLQSEIKTYKTVWNTLLNATSVKEASDIVVKRYEKPSNMSDQALEKRASFGQEFYDFFVQADEPSDGKQWVIATKDNVNLRCGNGKNYVSVTQTKTAGEKYEWVATAENGWHAIVVEVNHKNRVLWISPDYSKVQSG